MRKITVLLDQEGQQTEATPNLGLHGRIISLNATEKGLLAHEEDAKSMSNLFRTSFPASILICFFNFNRISPFILCFISLNLLLSFDEIDKSLESNISIITLH